MPNDTFATVLLVLALSGAFVMAHRLTVALVGTGRTADAVDVAAELAAIANSEASIVAVDVHGDVVAIETEELYIELKYKGDMIQQVIGAQSIYHNQECDYLDWQAAGRTPWQLFSVQHPQAIDRLQYQINAALDARKVIHY